MPATPFLTHLDEHVVTFIRDAAPTPIPFEALLRALVLQVGHNKVNEAVLQRRLKVLRYNQRLQYSRISPRGWTLTDDERNRSKANDTCTGS